jgi:hypothetical protein
VGNSYENFCLFGAHFYWYGADATLVCEHYACRDGKRLRRTRRLLRKSHSQWRASKLLSNDSGSSPIAIWHAGSRLSVDASQFALTIAAPGSGVAILIYPRRRPELLVWMAPGMSLFRNCEGHRTRSKQPCASSRSSAKRNHTCAIARACWSGNGSQCLRTTVELALPPPSRCYQPPVGMGALALNVTISTIAEGVPTVEATTR